MKKILLAFYVFAILSCNNNVSTINKEIVEEVINIEKALDDLSDDFSKQIDSTWFVTLKSPKENILGQISKVIVKDNRIYALDMLQAMKLNVYSIDGEYLATVGKRGKAKNEYLMVVDFDVTDKHIKILDRMGSSIIIYDKNTYEYINTVKIAFTPISFATLENGHYLLKTNQFVDMGDIGHNLLSISDSLLNNLTYHIESEPININVGTYIGIDHHFLRRDCNSALFYTLEYDYIYECDKNGAKPVYAIDFGKYTVPLEKRLDRDKFGHLSILNNYAFLATAPIKVDNSIFLIVRKNNVKYMVLYNIKENKATTVEINPNKPDLYAPYIPLGAYTGDAMVSLIDETIIEMCREAGQEINIEQTDTSSVLMFTKFK